MYPASSYDIPVTGNWDEDEKKMIRTQLKHYLTTNTYEKIIVHLPENLQEFILDLLPNHVVTCIQTPISQESLDNLSKTLSETTSSYSQVSLPKRIRENMSALASYQFSGKPAQELLQNSTVQGKYPYYKLFSNKNQIGMLTPERGCLSLTVFGAQRLLSSHINWVEAYDDVVLKGSLLAPGVKDADEAIRISDEVLIVNHEHVLLGVGVAQMNGAEMKQSSRGEAVKIRHHT